MRTRAGQFPPLRALPFFVPGWLYLPSLWYGIGLLPQSINENVLVLLVQIPFIASLIVFVPLAKGWITFRHVLHFLLVPNVLVGMMWISRLPD